MLCATHITNLILLLQANAIFRICRIQIDWEIDTAHRFVLALNNAVFGLLFFNGKWFDFTIVYKKYSKSSQDIVLLQHMPEQINL